MNNKAKKLSEYHNFTKGELHQILIEALDKMPSTYWDKPYSRNPNYNNGWYFNWCKNLIGCTEENKNKVEHKLISLRVLEKYMKFSKVQILTKQKTVEIKHIEKPFI